MSTSGGRRRRGTSGQSIAMDRSSNATTSTTADRERTPEPMDEDDNASNEKKDKRSSSLSEHASEETSPAPQTPIVITSLVAALGNTGESSMIDGTAEPSTRAPSEEAGQKSDLDDADVGELLLSTPTPTKSGRGRGRPRGAKRGAVRGTRGRPGGSRAPRKPVSGTASPSQVDSEGSPVVRATRANVTLPPGYIEGVTSTRLPKVRSESATPQPPPASSDIEDDEFQDALRPMKKLDKGKGKVRDISEPERGPSKRRRVDEATANRALERAVKKQALLDGLDAQAKQIRAGTHAVLRAGQERIAREKKQKLEQLAQIHEKTKEAYEAETNARSAFAWRQWSDARDDLRMSIYTDSRQKERAVFWEEKSYPFLRDHPLLVDTRDVPLIPYYRAAHSDEEPDEDDDTFMFSRAANPPALEAPPLNRALDHSSWSLLPNEVKVDISVMQDFNLVPPLTQAQQQQLQQQQQAVYVPPPFPYPYDATGAPMPIPPAPPLSAAPLLPPPPPSWSNYPSVDPFLPPAVSLANPSTTIMPAGASIPSVATTKSSASKPSANFPTVKEQQAIEKPKTSTFAMPKVPGSLAPPSPALTHLDTIGREPQSRGTKISLSEKALLSQSNPNARGLYTGRSTAWSPWYKPPTPSTSTASNVGAPASTASTTGNGLPPPASQLSSVSSSSVPTGAQRVEPSDPSGSKVKPAEPSANGLYRSNPWRAPVSGASTVDRTKEVYSGWMTRPSNYDSLPSDYPVPTGNKGTSRAGPPSGAVKTASIASTNTPVRLDPTQQLVSSTSSRPATSIYGQSTGNAGLHGKPFAPDFLQPSERAKPSGSLGSTGSTSSMSKPKTETWSRPSTPLRWPPYTTGSPAAARSNASTSTTSVKPATATGIAPPPSAPSQSVSSAKKPETVGQAKPLSSPYPRFAYNEGYGSRPQGITPSRPLGTTGTVQNSKRTEGSISPPPPSQTTDLLGVNGVPRLPSRQGDKPAAPLSTAASASPAQIPSNLLSSANPATSATAADKTRDASRTPTPNATPSMPPRIPSWMTPQSTTARTNGQTPSYLRWL